MQGHGAIHAEWQAGIQRWHNCSGRAGRNSTITGSSKMAGEEVEERGNAAQKDEKLPHDTLALGSIRLTVLMTLVFRYPASFLVCMNRVK